MIWDGVNSKMIDIEIIFYDNNHESIQFDSFKVPIKIQITNNEGNNDDIIYENLLYLNSSDSQIKIMKNDMNLENKSLKTGKTFIEIEKSDGSKIIQETTDLMLYILNT